jgi:hypothetical protein
MVKESIRQVYLNASYYISGHSDVKGQASERPYSSEEIF